MTASVIILGDQLLENHPALRGHDPASARVVLIESERRLRSLPYHRKKQVLILSAMRHYADGLRRRGFRVDYRRARTFSQGLREHLAEYAPERLVMMAASEFSARRAQSQLADTLHLPVDVLPNAQFLVESYDPFPDPDRRVIMETFYRAMRRHFRVLMAGADPVGGAWNFDHENRRPLPKSLTPPPLEGFPPDAITQQVMAEVEAAGHGVGTTEGFAYAVTHEGARRALDAFIAQRLPDFGAYEDAMTRRHRTLFHSVLSPYLNIGLLTPMMLVRAAEAAFERGDAPINSVEGFIRQVIGWREYMYWQYWRQMPALLEKNYWNARRPLPAFFWTGETPMNCLRYTLRDLEETAYSHHIQRLMLISSFCLMAGVEPQAVVAWFSSFYIDAYDWVMQPNVVGMGLNADGGITATKPYISSASYIHRMGDYCSGCAFDHRQRHGDRACPFNFLYWNFLILHEQTLRAHPRFGQAVLGLRYLSEDDRRAISVETAAFLDGLA